jgi:hypothetical protein
VASAEKMVTDKKVKKESSGQNDKLDPETVKNVRIMGMGNEPVFGDMLDSSKGIVGETAESEETKKEAVKHKDLPPGWNSFMLSNVNIDSLKNYRTRMKKDSVKTE